MQPQNRFLQGQDAPVAWKKFAFIAKTFSPYSDEQIAI